MPEKNYLKLRKQVILFTCMCKYVEAFIVVLQFDIYISTGDFTVTILLVRFYSSARLKVRMNFCPRLYPIGPNSIQDVCRY